MSARRQCSSTVPRSVLTSSGWYRSCSFSSSSSPARKGTRRLKISASPVFSTYSHTAHGSHSRSSEMRVRTPCSAPAPSCHQWHTSPAANWCAHARRSARAQVYCRAAGGSPRPAAGRGSRTRRRSGTGSCAPAAGSTASDTPPSRRDSGSCPRPASSSTGATPHPSHRSRVAQGVRGLVRLRQAQEVARVSHPQTITPCRSTVPSSAKQGLSPRRRARPSARAGTRTGRTSSP